jgi:two-component system chemotaxis response regulator CheB
MKIRVLIVDDSVVARRVLSDLVSADPGLEVVGTAANGSLGLQKIPQVNPDAIILDCEMPELNGIQTLAAIRKSYATLPVIMFSTNSEGGATATVEALSKGASDFINKPASVGDARTLLSTLGEELVRKVKALASRSGSATAPPTPPTGAPTPMAAPSTRKRIDILAIGSSTGGPAALGQMLPKIGAFLPVPLVMVQHMPPMFTRMLAERLTTLCDFPVHEAEHDIPLLAGHAYIAAGNFHMELKRVGTTLMLHTHQGPPENSCRPSVDVLFRSVADIFGSNALGVVLTGMGADGLRGSESILSAGGAVWAQDEATSVVWGMPGFVARAGLAEKVLPLDEIGGHIQRRIREFRPSTVY